MTATEQIRADVYAWIALGETTYVGEDYGHRILECVAEIEKETMQPAKYRKKPVEVYAMHFSTNNEKGSPTMDAIVNWVNQGRSEIGAWHNGTDIYIQTLEGEMKARCGDYVIRGVKGEFYPCKPEIFEATYDPVE